MVAENRFCNAITLHDYLREKAGGDSVSIGKRKHSHVVRIKNPKDKGSTIEQIAICEIGDLKYIPQSELRIKFIFTKLKKSNPYLYADISANFLKCSKYWGSKEEIKKQNFNMEKYSSSSQN